MSHGHKLTAYLGYPTCLPPLPLEKILWMPMIASCWSAVDCTQKLFPRAVHKNVFVEACFALIKKTCFGWLSHAYTFQVSDK